MHITYTNPGCEYSIESILLFQTGEETPFWSAPILHFYPQMDKAKLLTSDDVKKKEYLSTVFEQVYDAAKDEINRKVNDYNAHFAKYKKQIEDALSEAFDLDARSYFNDLTGNVTLNPICPRFLKAHSFDVFYKSSERGALGLSLHEVIHFFWFHVWNNHFSDAYEEYEAPSLKWILSEMVVEAIMGDRRLSTINPYFPRENGGCVYPYFQNMMINGTPILEEINALYQKNAIKDFMECAYGYCQKHEAAIRSHIMKAENAFSD